ncbi:hypothetical protein A2J03_27695 [Rhodococcus sp. EPR-157]|uniref:hypothetical protein n=1 Tax=Rhodococcus sp. EPR-157 TaxID=1813677 RepID=UPI0007BC4DC2|nr:hypothetical protein [Rhodococcus sp. EPR-157]KZF03885.1 hypothetical protein A2J03_27695 [Rhodococcus sp. EPR-157]
MASDDELTGTERLVLLVLMAQAEETSNTRLKELGPELKKDPRELLNKLRLIETDYSKRPMTHTLTEQGWAACARELKREPPPRATPQARGMYAILAGLQRYLDRDDLRLSDLFRAQKPATPEPTTQQPKPVAPAAPPTTPANIETRVREAYSRLADRKGELIAIQLIREKLTDIPKPKLDRALGDMYRIDDVVLIAQENQKDLTEAVRKGSITIAGRPVHLIAIEG